VVSGQKLDGIDDGILTQSQIAATDAMTLRAWVHLERTITELVVSHRLLAGPPNIMQIHGGTPEWAGYGFYGPIFGPNTTTALTMVTVAASAAESLFTTNLTRVAGGSSAAHSYSAVLQMGCELTSSTKYYMQGMVGEVALSSVIRNLAWTTTEFNNQSAPGTFSAWGAVESAATGGGPIIGSSIIGSSIVRPSIVVPRRW